MCQRCECVKGAGACTFAAPARCSQGPHTGWRVAMRGWHCRRPCSLPTPLMPQALEIACQQLEENYGAAVSGCQVVLVVDGGPSFLELRELERVIPHLPRSVVFHTVAMGSEAELQHCDIYKTLAQASRVRIRMHARVCVCMVHMCVYACMHACAHICMVRLCVYACMHVCMQACMRARSRAHTHTRTPTHLHPHAHAHTPTQGTCRDVQVPANMSSFKHKHRPYTLHLTPYTLHPTP
jgi:hypothetical protein